MADAACAADAACGWRAPGPAQPAPSRIAAPATPANITRQPITAHSLRAAPQPSRLPPGIWRSHDELSAVSPGAAAEHPAATRGHTLASAARPPAHHAEPGDGQPYGHVHGRTQITVIGTSADPPELDPVTAPKGGSGATCRRGLSQNVVESANAPELAADRVSGVLAHFAACPPGGQAGEAREAGPGVVRR